MDRLYLGPGTSQKCVAVAGKNEGVLVNHPDPRLCYSFRPLNLRSVTSTPGGSFEVGVGDVMPGGGGDT